MKDLYQKTWGLTPKICIENVAGTIQVKGWLRSEIYISGPEGSLDMHEESAGIRFSCKGDCIIRVPRSSMLVIDQVMGGARVKYLDEPLTIKSIYGSFAARSVGDITLGSVRGDILMKDVLGDCKVGQTDGSLILRDIQGECQVEHASGNVDLREASGSIQIQASGHVRLESSAFSGKEINILASGHVHCQVSEDINAHVHLSSKANNIRVHAANEKNTCQGPECEFDLGSGGMPINISAGGHLTFISRGTNWAANEDLDEIFNDEFSRISDDFSQRFQSQIETQIEHFNDQIEKLSEQMERIGLSHSEMQHVIDRAKRSSEEASLRAHEKMLRAEEKLKHKMSTAQRKMENRSDHHGHGTAGKPHWSFRWSQPQPGNSSSGYAAAADTEKERLAILQMLQEKKISLEQAELLLKSLEGN